MDGNDRLLVAAFGVMGAGAVLCSVLEPAVFAIGTVLFTVGMVLGLFAIVIRPWEWRNQ